MGKELTKEKEKANSDASGWKQGRGQQRGRPENRGAALPGLPPVQADFHDRTGGVYEAPDSIFAGKNEDLPGRFLIPACTRESHSS